MKIDRLGPPRAAEVYESYKKARTGQNPPATADRDVLELSREAQALRLLARQAAEPVVRDQLVEELRRRIGEGTYKVPAEAVAASILEEIRLQKTVGR